MKTTLLLLLSIVSANAATIVYDFSGIRFDQVGSVSTGSFTFDSKADNNTAVHSATFTLTDDFDADSTNDTLTFSLIATAAAGNINSNADGYVGVGNPRLDANETLTYSISLPGTVSLSGGGTMDVNFDGFTGGAWNGGIATSYSINDGATSTSATFSAANTSALKIARDAVVGNPFINGVNFSVSVVPEPTSSLLLALSSFAMLGYRRR